MIDWPSIRTCPSGRVLRQFACAWLVVLVAFAARQYLARGHHVLGVELLVAGLVPGIAGLLRPMLVRWLYVLAMFVAAPVGWVVSTLALILIFFGIVTPLAAFFRFRGRDLLQLKYDPTRKSYWLPKQTPTDVRSYFRQY